LQPENFPLPIKLANFWQWINNFSGDGSFIGHRLIYVEQESINLIYLLLIFCFAA
jgi:hypothetical protein